MAEEDQDGKQGLGIWQSMIDIAAERLIGLRTQCSTSNELTQREIRTLEVRPDPEFNYICLDFLLLSYAFVIHLLNKPTNTGI